MPIESESQALEALEQSFIADGTETDPIANRAAELRAEQAAGQGGSQEGSTEPEPFTRTDPSSLAPELQPIYKSMQADYTRKTQELAAERRAYAELDEFGGLDAARQAVEFASRLATDPNYAMEVHSQLTQALTNSGLSPQEAYRAATEAVTESANQGISGFDPEEFEDSALVNQLNSRLQEQDRTINELRAWQQQQEAERQQNAIINQLQLQQNEILRSHPDWDDKVLADVYSLAYSTNGNLLAAADAYEGMRNSMIENYISQKGSITPGVQAGNGELIEAPEPVKFEGLYDKRITELVNERLAQELAAEN